jgi:hypothetical protein
MIEKNVTPKEEVLNTDDKIQVITETNSEVKPITRSRTRAVKVAVQNDVKPEVIVDEPTPSNEETIETMKDSDKEKAKKAKQKAKEKKKEKAKKAKEKEKAKKKKAKEKEKVKNANAKKKAKAKKDKSKSKKKKK